MQQSPVFEHTNYRSYLKSVLAERKKTNPAYSLRAMARDLGIRASHLSAIHSGDKSLSLQNAMRIAAKLGLDSKQSDYFCTLVQFESVKTPHAKASLLEKLRDLNERKPVTDLNVDLFKAIADWYHIPILEMTNLEGFEFTAKNVAARLGITPLEAEVAIERLERLELLERDATGRYRKVITNYIFRAGETPNAGLRQFHREMLAKAADAIESQPRAERLIESNTVTIDPEQLPEVKALVDEFRARLVDLLEKGKRPTETYHLGIQFFNLTDKGKKL